MIVEDKFFHCDLGRAKSASWGSHVRGDAVTTRFYEGIMAQLSVADFLKIANASNVEAEVGPTRFRVKGKQLELCQELAEKIRR